MKKILFSLLALSLLFIGCSDNLPDIETDIPSQEENNNENSLEKFYETKTFGYKVKDTTRLDLINVNRLMDERIVLTGRRNERLWIAEFDGKSKEQISEFVDNEYLKINQEINLGYGNYENMLISNIQLQQLFSSNESFVANCILRGNSNNYKSMLVFTESNTVSKHFFDNNSNLLYSWFNDSYIYKQQSNGCYFIFDKKGNVLHENINSHHSVSDVFPVSYTDYIDVCFLYQTDEQPTLLRTWLGNHSYATNKWALWIPILKEKRAKYEVLLLSKESYNWSFVFDVTEYSGEKHSHVVTVNVENGKLISIN